MTKAAITSSQFLRLLTDFRQARLSEYLKNTGSTVSNLLFEAANNDSSWIKEELDKNVSEANKSTNEPKAEDYKIIYLM